MEAQVFNGDEENNTILVEVGSSTYGWNVAFKNGLRMSLSDVREYQARHNKLPDNSGVLSRGGAVLHFAGVKAIMVYEQPTYCGYGYGNAKA